MAVLRSEFANCAATAGAGGAVYAERGSVSIAKTKLKSNQAQV